MSANTNPTVKANVTVDEKFEVIPDSVKWTAKGNKIVYGNIADLTVDPTLNIRFRAGSEFFGVKVEKDTYDIPGMRQQVVDGGGIREPIWVSVRADASKIVMRGNRRTLTGQELLADETTPAELRKALSERTPMILFHGLTPEQEREMVNDQTQKSFLRSEVIRSIFELRRNGWTFPRIARLYWEPLGRFTGNAAKIAEIRDITDPNAKIEKITTWLRGTLDNYLIWGYDLGKFVQKCIMLSVMKIDGLLTANGEQPYFNTEKNSQKRIAALRKAKEADGTKFNGTIPQEGSEFKKLLDEYHSQDYGATPVVRNPGPKMMARKDLEGIKGSFQSQAISQMLEHILDTNKPLPTSADEFTAMCETKAMLVEQYLPRLKPEIAAIIRLCFVNPDPMDFQNYLESNQVEEITTEPEPETFDLPNESESAAAEDEQSVPPVE